MNIKSEKFEQQITLNQNTETKVLEEQESNEKQKYNEIREGFIIEQREIKESIIKEARKKRDQLLEERDILLMSKPDFYNYFSSKDFEVCADLKQQNVGDCGVVAAIHAMSRSPLFETICRSSMKKLPDGSWQVKVPLMSKDGRIITITQEEISPQKNRQFLKRSRDNGIIPDLRKNLLPVKGKEGLQVLEAAFIKVRSGSVDRSTAEGDVSVSVFHFLFLGKNFSHHYYSSSKYNPSKGKMEHPGLENISKKEAIFMDHVLENFDPGIYMATAGISEGAGNIFDERKVEGVKPSFLPKFVTKHEYSVSKVDSSQRMITLANPWDTSKPIELTFDQFKKIFTTFSIIRINNAELLSIYSSKE